MANESNATVEIELAIKAALYEPKPWHKDMGEVAMMLARRNAQRAVNGKASPVAGRALERIMSR